MVLITKRYAQVVRILPKKLEPMGTVELAQYEDYFDQKYHEQKSESRSNSIIGQALGTQ